MTENGIYEINLKSELNKNEKVTLEIRIDLVQ